ncbi:MAG: methionyl-tRNA formyltransferase [Rhizobiales bacterium]|nr:methionyl-tRNA formyltransferase [Hyphomicrobiales bacterium]
MGTPEFAVPTLSEIVGQGHEVVAVYSQPPRPAGRRGLETKKSPVHEIAERLGLTVRTPERLKADGEADFFVSLGADVAVVVAYGQILPRAFLAAPVNGALNLHASLLPRWRGAAPIERAIMAGDAETGVMVMQMEAGLDTGPVAMAERLPIGPDATAGEVTERLSRLGADLMVRALAALSRGALATMPQAAEGVTYAKKIEKSETRIDWHRPAAEVHNHIRGLSPDPGAWCEMDFGKGPERVKIIRSTLAEGSGVPGTVLDDALAVACGAGAIRFTELQRAGSRAMKAEEFLRGSRVAAGIVLPRGTGEGDPAKQGGGGA